jgi:hypothetical protein
MPGRCDYHWARVGLAETWDIAGSEVPQLNVTVWGNGTVSMIANR